MTGFATRAVISLPSEEEILITREFAAPPHLLYRAYTTPELVARWWCGQRGTVTVCEIDLRPGGSWRYVLRAHGGFDVGFHGVYEEIVPDERIVSTEVFEAMPEAEAHSTVVFRAAPDGHHTVLSILVRHASRENRDVHLRAGMEEGMNEAFDLLETVAGGSAVAR
jgi:uncharacterized protein YndB with AHSA1/START domain